MLTSNGVRLLSLDVGGANLKAAHSSGACQIEPFALWRHREALAHRLHELARGLPSFDRVLLTMTAELCDCYETKAEGVSDVLAAAKRMAGGRPVHVWGTDARFHTVDEIARTPLLAASANWLALAQVAAGLVGGRGGILIDVGSTTTDLIALRSGHARPMGRTDTERLGTGELVYAGVRRTPLCALATQLNWRGQATGLAAEVFATTLDVYLTLGEIGPRPDERDTADGRPAIAQRARERLARMVGADASTFSESDAVELASSADRCLVERMVVAARRIAESAGGCEVAVVSGSGVFLARRVAGRMLTCGQPIVVLDELWGAAASHAACARSLLVLWGEHGHA